MCAMPNPSPGDCRPLAKLPTLQRNALKKLFDRAEFTPEEVAGLGYRRIQQGEGIGLKGMATIRAWLAEYGYDLRPEPPAGQGSGRPRRDERKRLESALRVLRDHGYIIHRPEERGATASRPISK
jgi:hypothetical protein